MQDGAMKKKTKFGASLYYASDKNIFDALTRSRVNAETMQELFLRRNIIVSTKTDREDLAEYFSLLPHDFFDHRSISFRLDTVARRERLTSMDIDIKVPTDDLSKVIDKIKAEVESIGDIATITRTDGRTRLTVKYTDVDYRKTEFTQVQIRDGIIELIPSTTGFLIRSTHNEYINDVRESLVLEMESTTGEKAHRKVISLQGVPDASKRSKFFHDLMFQLPGYTVKDVHQVYVFKAKPEAQPATEDNAQDDDSHVERVYLRGNGVTRSSQLKRLLSDDNYYIVRVAWIVVEAKGHGQRYEIEARFEDPKDCTGFSFLLRGVYAADPMKNFEISDKRRMPNPGEVDAISLAIESHAKTLVSALNV
jgi:hypothetical protein